MSSSLAPALCDRMVGPLEAILSGVPDGTCIDIALSPLSAFVAIAAIGIAIACLQALVRALLFGRGRGAGRPRAAHEPELGLREAANRARARRLAGEAE